MYWAVLGCTWLFWAVLDSTGLDWAALGFDWLGWSLVTGQVVQVVLEIHKETVLGYLWGHMVTT